VTTCTAIPVIERIALEIVERLERISLANGFTFDVKKVVRNDRLGTANTPEHLMMEVVQGVSQYNADLSHPGNPPAIAWDTTFNIHCYVRESQRLETDVATTSNEMVAAVIKAITTPATSPSTWYMMGDSAVIAEFESSEPFSPGDGSHAGATIPLSVTHRQSENDPYEVRA
jgi:hypothetical protein